MKPLFFTVLATLIAGAADAQQACPCIPISHVWSVETCQTWNCAASAMIVANGDPYVMSMPAPSDDGRWLVVKRVNAGSYIASPDAPFVLEMFDGADGASARFMSVAADHRPMLLSVPDGKFVVVMSREALPKRKSARQP
jgi:hypothetical protein